MIKVHLKNFIDLFIAVKMKKKDDALLLQNIIAGKLKKYGSVDLLSHFTKVKCDSST